MAASEPIGFPRIYAVVKWTMIAVLTLLAIMAAAFWTMILGGFAGSGFRASDPAGERGEALVITPECAWPYGVNDHDAKAYLKILAYQASEQRCGFLPDAQEGGEDKKNVRDGHYNIWGPLHFFVKAERGMVKNPMATEVVDYLTGFTPLPVEDKFALTIVSTQAATTRLTKLR